MIYLLKVTKGNQLSCLKWTYGVSDNDNSVDAINKAE